MTWSAVSRFHKSESFHENRAVADNRLTDVIMVVRSWEKIPGISLVQVSFLHKTAQHDSIKTFASEVFSISITIISFLFQNLLSDPPIIWNRRKIDYSVKLQKIKLLLMGGKLSHNWVFIEAFSNLIKFVTFTIFIFISYLNSVPIKLYFPVYNN